MDKARLANFFADLYSYAPQGIGVVEMRLISHIGDLPQRRFFASPAGIAEQANKWAERYRKAGVYFGVAMRKPGGGGKKEDCACVTALWVDIDVRKEGWDMQRTLGALKMSEFRPSLIVNSGNGYHCYWLLREPITLVDPETAERNIERIEAANAALGVMFGGDPSAKDVTRVLRVPYTYNTKGEKVIDVTIAVEDWHLDYTIEELEEASKRDGCLFDGEWLSSAAIKEKAKEKKANAKTNGLASRLLRENGLHDRALSLSEIWRHTKYGGVNDGNAYMGVDEAILRSTALLYARFGGEWSDAQIVDEVFYQVKKVKERDAPKEVWNWTQERREIEEKLERFKPRWEKMKEEAKDGAKKRKGGRRKTTVG
jgi:hypothetical protein